MGKVLPFVMIIRKTAIVLTTSLDEDLAINIKTIQRKKIGIS